MSTNADITIRLTTDAGQATEGLRRTEREIRRTARSAAELRRQFGATRTAAGAPAASLEGLTEIERRNEQIRRQFELTPQGRARTAAGALPVGFAAKQSSTAEFAAMGKAIGLAAGGYLANAAVSGIAAGFASQEGGSRTAKRITNIGGGIAGGAAAGAMIGSVVPGLGTAIGAVGGALIGGVGGALKTLLDESAEEREGHWALNHQIASQARGTEIWKQDTSFQRLLSTKGIDEQKDLLGDRIAQIDGGDGPNSIRNLRAFLAKSVDDGKTDTAAYREASEMLTTQLQRKSLLERQQAELEVAPRAALLEGSSVSDSLSRMGGQVGAQVDISSVNERQLEMLQKIYDYFTRKGVEDVSQSIGTSVLG